jgi:hypothetical protein
MSGASDSARCASQDAISDTPTFRLFAREKRVVEIDGLDLLVRAGCGCLLTAGQAFAEPLASPGFGGPLKLNRTQSD